MLTVPPLGLADRLVSERELRAIVGRQGRDAGHRGEGEGSGIARGCSIIGIRAKRELMAIDAGAAEKPRHYGTSI
jgi:hypothetical protein